MQQITERWEGDEREWERGVASKRGHAAQA